MSAAARAAEGLESQRRKETVAEEPQHAEKPVPAYLQPPPTGVRTYGTVRREGDFWIIEADAYVTELAKRLFHGSRSLGRGFASIPATRRTIADLNWLMIRYPLKVDDVAAYERDLAQAVVHAEKLEQMVKVPQEISVPLRVPLMKFQREGVAFLMHNRRALLADEAGLGKSCQAIGFLIAAQTWPALIVVPPHLLRQWPEELVKFVGTTCSVHVLKGTKPYQLPRAHVYLTHYLLLQHWRQVLEDAGISTVIFDEIQDLRHHETSKYAAASSIAGRAHNVIGLSGSPVYNLGGEIWAILNIIEFHCLGTRDAFTRDYCTAYGSPVVADPAVLGAKLRNEGLFLRRTKEQVMPELPAKRRVVQEIGMDEGLYGPLIEQAVKAAMRVEHATGRGEAQAFRRMAIEASRQATGVAKASYVAAFVKTLLEAGEPVLLFAYHHAVFKTYMEELAEWKPVEISGRVPDPEDRKKACELFMSGGTDLMIISLRAATGLNLQRARCVVFGELDWSPACHSQGEDRAHRIGTKDSVLAYYLVAGEGSDREIQDALGLKISQFVGLMGDREETEEEKLLAAKSAAQHMEALLTRLRKKGKLSSESAKPPVGLPVSDAEPEPPEPRSESEP